eukprot:1818887-Amphidinium_carterae.2
MSEDTLLSKAASLAWSTHIMASGINFIIEELAHQKAIKVVRRILQVSAIRAAASTHIGQQPNTDAAGTQQLFHQGVAKARKPGNNIKWSEAYVWCSIKDAGQFALGDLRPSRSHQQPPCHGQSLALASRPCFRAHNNILPSEHGTNIWAAVNTSTSSISRWSASRGGHLHQVVLDHCHHQPAGA